MPGSSRLRRSVLYMPGANSRALEKARTLPCDGVILDLEDAVAPDAKAKARQQIAEALTAGGYGTREVVVRINSLDGPWGREDLAAFASRRPDAILLPKVESPQQLCDLDQAMKKLGYDRETAIWAMMETPRGILAADRIAAGTDRLACFVMGTNDLAKDLRLAPTPAREGFATSFGLALLAARAFGLAILDGVYGDLQDAEGFEQECRQGVMLGFDGKTLVHPKQIGPANDLFRPSADAIAHATRMLAAWKDAEAQGKGVATLDGKMIEHLHIQDAQRLLALDHAIKTRG